MRLSCIQHETGLIDHSVIILDKKLLNFSRTFFGGGLYDSWWRQKGCWHPFASAAV